VFLQNKPNNPKEERQLGADSFYDGIDDALLRTR
jgi:hypothetical protein